MSATAMTPTSDPQLAADVLAHLDTQIGSATQLLAIVLRQGKAARAADAPTVLDCVSELQAQMDARSVLEQQRTSLLQRAGALLGTPAETVTLEQLIAVTMSAADARTARTRSAELRGLLAEVEREHICNRGLMRQELAFLDHLLRLAGPAPAAGYESDGARPVASETVSVHRVLDLRA
jgi:hypothetical protein